MLILRGTQNLADCLTDVTAKPKELEEHELCPGLPPPPGLCSDWFGQVISVLAGCRGLLSSIPGQGALVVPQRTSDVQEEGRRSGGVVDMSDGG